MPVGGRNTRSKGAPVALALLLALAGCQATPHAPDRATVSRHLTQRVGHTVPPRTPPGQLTLPPGAARKLLAIAAGDDADPASPPPDFASRYEIVRELGRGGMGIVYEAVDRHLARRCAVKEALTPTCWRPSSV